MNHRHMEKIFFVFLISISVIDSVNGFLLDKVPLPVSVGQIFRLLFIVFLVYIIIKNRYFNLYPMILISYLIVTQLFFYTFYHRSIHGLINDYLETFKFILIVLIIEAYKALKNSETKTTLIRKIIFVNTILFPIILLLPKLFGAGYSMYSNNVGYSGFFTAPNDLNVVLLVLFIFSLDLLCKIDKFDKFLFIYSFLSLIIFIGLLLLGSKSSIAFGALIIFIYLIVIIRRFPKKKIIFGTISLMIVLIGAFGIIFKGEIQKSFDRHSYFFKTDVEEGGNVLSFILTGRDRYLNSAMEAYSISDNQFLRFWAGTGMYQHSVDTAKHFHESKRDYLIIEMDFWDILFSNGLIGVLLIYGYFGLILFVYLKKGNINLNFLLSFILIFIYSFLGGHVLYSAMAGSILAIVCCGMHTTNHFPLYKNKIPFF